MFFGPHPGTGAKQATADRHPRLSAFHGLSAAAPARYEVARMGWWATKADV
jgi:hypothetical protein